MLLGNAPNRRHADDARKLSAIDIETVDIAPRDLVKRRTATPGGMTAEIIQASRRERIEFRYRGPRHMLIAYEQGVRRDGVTVVEGLPRSNLRDFRKKLTFVPAGHDYHEV